jgi:CheY-like chemotaxis protein
VEPVRVLVVDDDNALRDMMVEHLRKKGFLVEDAQDGREAIETLRSCGPFSVMVTDLMMPGMSGLELLRRAKKLDPILEVIVITAAGSIDMAISALREDGAYDYLTKPMEMIGELSLAVERAANHRQIRLEREAMRGSLLNGARRLKEILNSAGLAVIAGNERDELVVISPAAADLLGFEIEDARKGKGSIPKPIRILLEGWRSLGGKYPTWVETPWTNGKDKLIRIAPMPMANSLGWVMLFQDITYVKCLERFLVESYARVVNTIKQPMDRALVVIKDLDRRLRAGKGDPLVQVGHLKQLFEKAYEASQNLMTLNGNGTQPSTASERILLNEFLDKMQSSQGSKHQKIDREGYRWELVGAIPPIELERTLLSQLFHYLVKYVELRSESKEDILIRTFSANNRIWLSVTNNGNEVREESGNSSGYQAYEPWRDSFNQGQMELAVAKSKAAQMGHQVWLYQIDDGGLAVAVCFYPEKGNH